MDFIYGIKSTFSRKCAEDLSPTILAWRPVRWDASCTCSADGHLLSATPHLHQLLSATSVVGSDLASYAADDTDAARLCSPVMPWLSVRRVIMEA